MRFNFEDGSFKDFEGSKNIYGLKQKGKRPISVTLDYQDFLDMTKYYDGLLSRLIDLKHRLDVRPRRTT